MREDKPFEIVWDGHIWDLDLWVIPKGTAAAMSLIYFAITLLVSWLFYTLMNREDLNTEGDR
jgi:hypothetical protein